MLNKSLLLVLLTGILSLVQAATDIVIPLYSYPGSSQWQATFDAIQANPNVRFQVIINPDSGPKSSTPDAAFAAASMQLKSYSNVQVLGYVRTGYANRAQATVTGEVDEYAAWPDASKVQGIFYDETAQNAVDYMTAITTYARTRFNSAVVMFNPGTTATTAYYNIADFVMIAEIPYSATAANTMTNLSAPSKAAIIIYSVPSLEASQSLVSTAISNNIGSVYFTQDPATYQQMGTDWSQFVSYMSAGQASAPSSSSSGTSSSQGSDASSVSTTTVTTTDTLISISTTTVTSTLMTTITSTVTAAPTDASLTVTSTVTATKTRVYKCKSKTASLS